MNSIDTFKQFFEHCVGSWQTERTYHYLSYKEVERSHTDFVISALTAEIKTKVITDNDYPLTGDLSDYPGFHLEFQTVSEQGEKVQQMLNMVFAITQETDGILTGDYLRDRAYEEAKPMISQFQFDPTSRELLMTTNYTSVVSIDSITMVNPRLRLRRIINYRRPPAGEPLQDVILVGFGVEQKVN
jgi:CpeS-like protein